MSIKSGRKSLPALFVTNGSPRSAAAEPSYLTHDLDLYYIRQIASHLKVALFFLSIIVALMRTATVPLGSSPEAI